MESLTACEPVEPDLEAPAGRPVSLSALRAGSIATVVSVGTGSHHPSALERRLLELGFVRGEQVEIIAEARPGLDPFVVRIGSTTLALRRREVQSVWVAQRTETA